MKYIIVASDALLAFDRQAGLYVQAESEDRLAPEYVKASSGSLSHIRTMAHELNEKDRQEQAVRELELVDRIIGDTPGPDTGTTEIITAEEWLTRAAPKTGEQPRHKEATFPGDEVNVQDLTKWLAHLPRQVRTLTVSQAVVINEDYAITDTRSTTVRAEW